MWWIILVTARHHSAPAGTDRADCAVSQMSIAANPAARAAVQHTSFALKKDFLLSARSGREECPSWAMQLASRTGSGTIPLA